MKKKFGICFAVSNKTRTFAASKNKLNPLKPTIMKRNYFADNYITKPSQRRIMSDFKDNQVLGLYRSIRNKWHNKCRDIKDISKLLPYKF